MSASGPVTIDKTLAELHGKLIGGETKTGKSTKRVYLPRIAAERMEELRKEGPLVPDTKGNRMAPVKIAKLYRGAVEKAGLGYVPIGRLRSSFASVVIATGGNPMLLDMLMGHSTTKAAGTTVLYEYYLNAE